MLTELFLEDAELDSERVLIRSTGFDCVGMIGSGIGTGLFTATGVGGLGAEFVCFNLAGLGLTSVFRSFLSVILKSKK